jgi:hypothetical protein
MKQAIDIKLLLWQRWAQHFFLLARPLLTPRSDVGLTMADIPKDSPVLADLESRGAIKIAGTMYNLKTGVVDFLA